MILRRLPMLAVSVVATGRLRSWSPRDTPAPEPAVFATIAGAVDAVGAVGIGR